MAKKVKKKAKVKKAKVKKAKKSASAAKRAVKKRTVKKSTAKKRTPYKLAPKKVARPLGRSDDPCQGFREAVDGISQQIAADRDLLSQPDLSPEDRAQIEERLSRRETDLGLAERALDQCVASHPKRA
jgi:hypothetical protein